MEDLGVGRREGVRQAAGYAGDGAPVAFDLVGERLGESVSVAGGDDEKIPWLLRVEERVDVDFRGRDDPSDYLGDYEGLEAAGAECVEEGWDAG